MYNLLLWLMNAPEYNYQINQDYYCRGRWGQVPGCLVLLCCLILGASPVFAASLLWDRNTEPDMKDYGVYACLAPGCVPAKTLAMLQGFIVQVPSGGTPQWPIPITKEGSVGVTARDLTLNESGLSVPINFDALAPSVPGNPRVQ